MKKILIYSGNPATDAHLHGVNIAAVAKANRGDVITWIITAQPYVDNAIAALAGTKAGDHVILKATSGFPNPGAVATGKLVDYPKGTFLENGTTRNVCLNVRVELTDKFSTPKPCGGRRAPGHALFVN
jgi:hypothetical protein